MKVTRWNTKLKIEEHEIYLSLSAPYPFKPLFFKLIETFAIYFYAKEFYEIKFIQVIKFVYFKKKLSVKRKR